MALKDLSPDDVQSTLQGMSLRQKESFEEFYLHFQPQLTRFVRKYLRDRAAAEEVVNDTLLHVCTHPLSFKGEAKFSTWLCQIARNKAIDALRAAGHRPELQAIALDEPEALALADATPWANVQTHVEGRQARQQFQRCMGGLPSHLAEVVTLSIVEEWTETEVAHALGCPVGTVKSRLFTARKALQQCMQMHKPQENEMSFDASWKEAMQAEINLAPSAQGLAAFLDRLRAEGFLSGEPNRTQ